MSAQPVGNVVPLHRDHTPVCDPSTGEVIPAHDVQQRLTAMADELRAVTKALGNATRLNESLRTQLTRAKEEQAEASCEDPDLVRRLIRHHYSQVGRTKKTIPLSGVDATIVRWLLDRCDFTPRDIALASWAFCREPFYVEKGLVSLSNMATSKVDGKRVKDEEKVARWVAKAKQIRGEV